MLAGSVAAAAPAVAPAQLVATPGDGRITLGWQPVAGATGYRVYRTTTGVFGTTPLKSVGGTTYQNSGLINGTLYSYKVAAYNNTGTGPASAAVSAIPLAPPLNLTATPGNTQATLGWQSSQGASSYKVYRSTTSSDPAAVVVGTTAGLGLVDLNLTNGTRYYYRVKALVGGVLSGWSAQVSARPRVAAPASAPSSLTAVAGNRSIHLTWSPVATATSYRLYRTTDGVWPATPLATVSVTTYTNENLTNGTTYQYRVAARNAGGDGPPSEPVSATPVEPPPAPSGVTATAGDGQATLSWTAVPQAQFYSVYRGTSPGQQSSVPVGSGLTSPSFLSAGLQNGLTYYYTVTGSNTSGEGARSNEVSASPEGPPPAPDPATVAAFQLLRQATWGPRPGDVDTVKTIGSDTFLNQQLSAAASVFPDTLFTGPVEGVQEHFFQVAITGPDQLRQRMAWALHKIWVVSAVEVEDAGAIVTYQRILLNNAFGNYRTLMGAITRNPAMGRYLNMLNNFSQQVTGTPANENYARELMQLFTIGIPTLGPDGTAVLVNGQQVPSYTESDVKALARIFTGWTFAAGGTGDIDPTTPLNENFLAPMVPNDAYHDNEAKTFLGQGFPQGQSANGDVDQALDLLFNHPNVGPFVSRQLIQQLVTSNPSPTYIAAVAAVFADNGNGVRGDLSAVLREILTRPEATTSTNTSGKLSEPVLFILSQVRALNAVVVDHPFMSDLAEQMGQKVFYPPSVFSYFSPGYRIRGINLGGPEFQTFTSVTALERANFVAALLGGYFGGDVAVDYSPFTSRAENPSGLVDYCSLLLMGGRMSIEERTEIIAAVRAVAMGAPDSPLERAHTALYLTLVAAQGQVDR